MTYPSNPQATVGFGTPGTIEATNVIIFGPNDKLLVYKGNPAKGNLVAEITAQDQLDKYGNQVLTLANFGMWNAVTGQLQQHFGIDLNGNTVVVDSNGITRIANNNNPPATIYYNTAGAVTTYIDPINSAIWQYQDNTPVNNAVIVNHTKFTSTSTAALQSFVLPWTPVAGNTLVLCCRTTENVTNFAMQISGIKSNFNVDNWTQDRQDGVSGTDNFICQTWSNPGLTVANSNLEITFNNSGANSPAIHIEVMEVSGIVTVSPLDGPGNGKVQNTATATFTTNTAGPSTTNFSIAVANLGIVSTATPTITGVGTWTVVENNLNTVMAYQLLSTTGSVTCSGTLAPNGAYTAQVVIYKVVGSASQGQLVFAQCAKATNDPVTSVACQPGLTLFSTNGKKLWLDTSPISGAAGMSFFTGTAEENSQGSISNQVINPGASETLALQLFGPGNTNSPAHPFISLVSDAKDGSLTGAGFLEYVTPTGATVSELTWGVGGLDGGTDKGFVGGIDLTQTDQFTRATGNTTTHTQVSGNFAIPAGDTFSNGVAWELTVWGNAVTGAAVGAVGMELAIFGITTLGISFTPPVAINTTYNWTVRCSILSGSGAAATYTAKLELTLAQNGATWTTANTLNGSMLSTGTVNTTLATTAQLNAWFAGLSAGQTVQGVGSIFRRIKDA